MRFLFGFTLIVVLIAAFAGPALCQTGVVHKYDDYGFSVTLPQGSERIPLSDLGGGGMQEAYQSNGLAYVIMGTSDVQPRGMSATAVIAMMMQVVDYVKSKYPSAPIHAISATTAQGVAAKGIAVTGDGGSGNKARSASRVPPEIARMFGNDAAISMLLVPVVDSPALLAGVLVVGPGNRASELDGQVIQLASTIQISKPTNTRLSGLALPKKGAKQPAAPPQPDIKPINTLKKGQIELIGVVKTADAAGKCVDMLVGQAVPYGGHGAVINPARLKRVYVKEIAPDVKEGAIIIVVAGDTGPGKAVTADTLTVMDPSKLGF